MISILAYQILIPLLLVAVHVLLCRRFHTSWNPLSMTIVWWGFWLWIATFSFTGMFPPDEKMICITLTMLTGLAVGAFAAPRPPATAMPLRLLSERHEPFYRRFTKVYPWALGFSLLLVVPVFIRGLFGLVKFGTTDYRSYAFGTPERVGWLFQSNILESLYFIISGPLFLGILLIGMALFFMTGRGHVLMAGVGLSMMDGLLRLGRANIYMVGLLGAISATLILGLRKSNPDLIARLMRKMRFAAILMGVLFVFLAWISVFRSDKSMRNISDQFNIFVVDYHTVGFTLFGRELENPQSDVRTKLTYGRLTFGGLDSLLAIAIRRFDRSYNCPALVNMMRMTEPQVVGYEKGKAEKIEKTYNSYYTILYTLYSDGRFLGLFLGGLALGFLMTYFYTWWRTRGELEPLVWVLFLLSVCILGIFVSTLENMRSWLVVLGLCGLRGRFFATDKAPGQSP